MFCRHCGKQIEDGSAFCAGCGAPIEKEEKAAEPFFAEEVKAQPVTPVSNPRMEGFGRALTGAIFSFVAMIFYFIAADVILWASYSDEVVIGLFLEIASLVFSILAVVFGIKSIVTFCRAKVKPIATLILGIASLAMGAIFLICEMIVFFAILALL